ncbi:MAG: hypothetical protein WCG25_00280 [bacterium]
MYIYVPAGCCKNIKSHLKSKFDHKLDVFNVFTIVAFEVFVTRLLLYILILYM